MSLKDKAERSAYQSAYYKRRRETDPIFREQERQKRIRGRAARANYQLQKLYGITLEDKQRMLTDQGGLCGNDGCKLPLTSLKAAHVDHHHGSGRIRGLLCRNCNFALGLLCDDPAVARGLADYAEAR